MQLAQKGRGDGGRGSDSVCVCSAFGGKEDGAGMVIVRHRRASAGKKLAVQVNMNESMNSSTTAAIVWTQSSSMRCERPRLTWGPCAIHSAVKIGSSSRSRPWGRSPCASAAVVASTGCGRSFIGPGEWWPSCQHLGGSQKGLGVDLEMASRTWLPLFSHAFPWLFP